MSRSEAVQYAITAFDFLIPAWQEASHRSDSGFYPVKTQDPADHIGAGRATHTSRSCIVVPTYSDFVADVQLCANRVLNPEQLQYFNFHYGRYSRSLSEVHPNRVALDRQVRIRLGRGLVAAGISPFMAYTAPFDVRGYRYPERMRQLAVRQAKQQGRVAA